MSILFALGDSLTCGQGVGVHVPAEHTWPALLSRGMDGAGLRSLAAPGARIRDVRRAQLPLLSAEAARGGLVSVLAGLNDICRSGFDPPGIRADLTATVAGIRRLGSIVLLARLHDPMRVLRLRGRIAAIARRRIDEVNLAVDEVAAENDAVLVLDLATVPALATPGGWAADRIHPSPLGHQAIAAAAARILAEARLAPAACVAEPAPVAGPSRSETAWWAMRHGMPYTVGHLRDFGPPLLAALSSRVIGP